MGAPGGRSWRAAPAVAVFSGCRSCNDCHIAGGTVPRGGRTLPMSRSAEKAQSMSTTDKTGPHSLGSGVRALRPKWGWIVGFGVFSLIAGVIALGSTVIATASAVYIVGFMMLFAGVAEIVAAFNAKDWGHRLLWLLLGALYVFAGIICLQNPFEAATILTLMLGLALIIPGVLRIFLATRMKPGTPSG